MKIQTLLAYSSYEERWVMQSGISAAVVFIWKDVQNPASLSTGGAKITATKQLFSPTLYAQPPFVTTPTQN